MSAERCDLLVLGGGPAGSTVAAMAARAGLEVVLLEADQHPRAHVGESLLPGIIPILEAIGALAAVEAAGFGRKSGTTHFQWGTTPEWDLFFRDTDLYEHAWLVDRARFDAILLDAARRAGARVIELAAAKAPIWEDGRLVGVSWRARGEEAPRELRARFVVDATGQASFLARHLELRERLPGLQHQAAWAHWEGAGRLPPPREHQAVFVAEARCWLWLFPLSIDRASVGVISLDSAPVGEAEYVRAIRESGRLSAILGEDARRVTPVRSQRDWSYEVRAVCGPGWLLCGDASGFIDPVLSTGVFLAMHAAYLAGGLLSRALSGALAEEAALAEYQSRHRELFGDLLRMVRFYYQQNLAREDYFWESKRILMHEETALRPQKAFLVLTSGLVKNLALDDVQAAQAARRGGEAGPEGGDLATHDPDHLGFICVQLRHLRADGEAPALFFLIEGLRPAEPALFRTRHWQLNCLAPRYGNDPIREPRLAAPLRALAATIRRLDDREGSLAEFWRRARVELAAAAASLAPELEVVRIFGE
jgi:flavin-dependent dehydrogenase